MNLQDAFAESPIFFCPVQFEPHTFGLLLSNLKKKLKFKKNIYIKKAAIRFDMINHYLFAVFCIWSSTVEYPNKHFIYNFR